MPITNKEAAPNAAMKAEILDYASALEVVKTYTNKDGLDVDTLLDSDKHGALTYNDFLILPGYIGKLTTPTCQKNLWRGTSDQKNFLTFGDYRFPCLRCHSGHPGH